MDRIKQQVAAIVGDDYVSDDGALFAVHGVRPRLVVSPANAAELGQVVATLGSAGVAVVPWGGGTQQRWGWPLAHDLPFAVVRTTRLNRVLDYTPDDLTISVGAGMTLDALSAALAANGQMLPLDVPLPERATVGGVLATAMDGPRTLGYGRSRDLLIGISVVEASGRISKAGGMVVKNVSGFDMMRLYTGSLGTLAIIVSANFKLMPLPRDAATVLCNCATLGAACGLAERIGASTLVPVAVELLSDHEGVRVAVRAEGLPAAVERHSRDVSAFAADTDAYVQVLRDVKHTSFWARTNNLPQTAVLAPDEVVARISCLRAELANALELASSLAARLGLTLHIAARVLSGLAYLRVSGPADALRSWHTTLLAARPTLTVLAAPELLMREGAIWGSPPANIALLRRIKAEFDPQDLLNPRRYVV
jgi:glycolate oxidase FAD binding subunit